MSSVVSRAGAAARVVWISAGMQARASVGLFGLIATVFMPASFLVVATRVVDAPGPEFVTRVVVAVGLMSLWASTVWGAGGILRRELRDGTFVAVATGVHPPQLVLLGKSLGATVYSMAVIAPTTAVVLVLLDLRIRVERPLWTLLGLVVVAATGTALGLLMACVFLLSRYGTQLSGALMYPIYLLGGMLVPPSELPAFVQPVAAMISLRWATEFLVAAAGGQVSWPPLVATLVLTIAYLVSGRLAFGKVMDLARRDGRLAL